jgi:hypothetical protein
MKKDVLLKALQSVALGYSEGNLSVDKLIKACEVYKQKTDFEDNYDYQIMVAKSLFDSINGNIQDLDIAKAILPGQTKVVDGVMYIYSPTAPGSKQPYDWHVVKKGSKTGKEIGGGAKLSDKQAEEKQAAVNELFPLDPNSLTVVNAGIGGSTGAQLVEDAQGNRYIRKVGTNTNNGHVRSEYLTNQLYGILGLRTPDYELYEEKDAQGNDLAVLLSRFIPMAKQPTQQDYAELAKGFIVDTLLANWDVYMNDNCLKDSAGVIYRVDNGGALDYRAQGSKKPFDGDIASTFKGMVYHNPNVYQTLSNDDILAQIQDLRSKKQQIVDFLVESGEDALAIIIEERINNLKDIENILANQASIEDIKIQPRTLNPNMYDEFTEEELQEFFDNAQGSDAYGKLMHRGKYGWELLKTICDKRGFSARPRVITEAEYWQDVQNGVAHQVFRGLSDAGMMTKDDCAKSLLFEDECFYGATGVYGEGIYNAGGDCTDPTKVFSDYGFQEAKSYARQSGSGLVIKGYLEKDAKIVDYDAIYQEVANLTFDDSDTLQVLQDELQAIDDRLIEIDNEVNNAYGDLEKEVYEEMQYDQSAITDMEITIDSVNWGAVDAFGERDIPSFDEFVKNYMKNWVEANGGEMIQGKGLVRFKLPNVKEVCTISEYQYDGPYSIVRKNPFAPAYDTAVERFRQWMRTNKVQAVETEVNARKGEVNQKINDLLNEKKQLKLDHDKKEYEIRNAQNGKINPEDGILQAIKYNRGASEVLGIYAAIKGYDAIRKDFGNGQAPYYAVVNRSKLVYSNKVEYV